MNTSVISQGIAIGEQFPSIQAMYTKAKQDIQNDISFKMAVVGNQVNRELWYQLAEIMFYPTYISIQFLYDQNIILFRQSSQGFILICLIQTMYTFCRIRFGCWVMCTWYIICTHLVMTYEHFNFWSYYLRWAIKNISNSMLMAFSLVG